MSTRARPGAHGRSVPTWVVELVATVVLVAGCVTGGVAATTLFPSTAETINYQAQLRLSVNARDVSRIHSPTLFGDINLDFDSPVIAPGVLANLQVKPQITDLLAQPKVSIKALEPGPLELSNAARDAGFALGLRFVLGALAVAVAALAAYAVWRRRRPPLRRLAAAGACWLIACLATGGSIWQTYQPEGLESFKTTGILGAIQRNADLLAGVETRAQQTTPYLKNLLALSAALQDKYSPQEFGEPVAARILLVSDIHGAQQYPLMRTIIEEEQIDAVVDAGDLLNFGSVAEGDAAGIFEGIAALDVPYLFVRGNHDALSADDTSVLNRLARIPNVVLLQPDDEFYTQESVNGIRIAGFNDPRWFGDDNRNNAEKQVPAAEAFVRTFEGRPRPDLVVSHEPGAVADIERADIRVHGHLHSDQLEDNVIGVGTFTGGGPFSHFLEGAEGEERTGQPSAFDIATFGQDCQLTSLTRYQFRNVIEGRPAYDDVTLINGSRIEAAPETDENDPQPDPPERTCGSALGITGEQVPAVPR